MFSAVLLSEMHMKIRHEKLYGIFCRCFDICCLFGGCDE